jgi:tetratricopeptide (TPR) repeat protein
MATQAEHAAERPAALGLCRDRASGVAAVLRFGFWSLVVALIVLNAWWALDPRRPEDLSTINQWITQKRYDESRSALREHLRRSPHDGEARMMLARTLAASDDLLACARELHEVPFWWPAKSEALFLEGQAFLMVHRARDAEASWKACMAADPFHPAKERYFSGAARELIRLYAMENRFEEARQAVWKAYQQASPEDRPAVLIMRLRCDLERIEPAEVAVQLRRFVAADPNDWEARRALARAEQDLGHPAEATRLIKECVKARPNDAHAWSDCLEIFHSQGDLDALVDAVHRLPSSTDSDPDVWKLRGRVWEWAGDFRGAADAYSHAVHLRPYDSEFQYCLAMAEERLGERKQAEQDRRQSQKLQKLRAALRDAYQEFVAVSAHPKGEEDRRSATIDRLASACDQLGLEREADELRRLVTPG